jgi:hypothetical protein
VKAQCCANSVGSKTPTQATQRNMADPARVESVDDEEEEMNLMETGDDGVFRHSCIGSHLVQAQDTTYV